MDIGTVMRYRDFMNKNQTFRYTIRQVIDLTGVSEFTLRGWETRYNAIQPSRSETGRRHYSKSDLIKVKLLQNLLGLGHRIGKIADLSIAELEHLQANHSTSAGGATELATATKKQVQQISELVIRFDWNEVERLFNRAMKTKKTVPFIFEFLLPLISEVNAQVGRGQFGIAQEHILSALIKKSLNFKISQKKGRAKRDLRLIFATPEGDFHEIGLLVAAALANSKGAQVLYLGPNVPAADLCETCLRYKATHVVLTSTVSTRNGAKEDYLHYINFIDRQIDANTQLFLAGPNAIRHPIELKREHRTFKSFNEFQAAI